LYLIVEFQKLKEAEQKTQNLDWNVKRLLSKINFQIHTDAVKGYLIPPRLEGTAKVGGIYASEADLLNLAVFGITAKEWKVQNPGLKGNMRDHATPEQLLTLANIESLNAEFIKAGLGHEQRLEELNQIAIYQLSVLLQSASLKKFKNNKKLN